MSKILSLIVFLFVVQRAKLQDLRSRVNIAPGYTVEYRNVTTSDGYILGVYRMSGGPVSPPAAGKPVVFVMHGLICSWADWMVLGAGKSIIYMLSDAGYDVWMGNQRGNTFSRNHVTLSTIDLAFWDFSFHEIGIFDLPTMINLALSTTGQTKCHYIGHSQGTTSFFVMTTVLPQMNEKIITMHAFAPAVFMTHLFSPALRSLVPFAGQPAVLEPLIGNVEFLASSQLLDIGAHAACQNVVAAVCQSPLFLLLGIDFPELNNSLVAEILQNVPAGASTKQFIHLFQEANSGLFRHFDYGPITNFVKYQSNTPPNYDLSLCTAPVFLYYGDNDWGVALVDVKNLDGQLGNRIAAFEMTNPQWNHLDFLYAIHAPTDLYPNVIQLIKTYVPSTTVAPQTAAAPGIIQMFFTSIQSTFATFSKVIQNFLQAILAFFIKP